MNARREPSHGHSSQRLVERPRERSLHRPIGGPDPRDRLCFAALRPAFLDGCPLNAFRRGAGRRSHGNQTKPVTYLRVSSEPRVQPSGSALATALAGDSYGEPRQAAMQRHERPRSSNMRMRGTKPIRQWRVRLGHETGFGFSVSSRMPHAGWKRDHGGARSLNGWAGDSGDSDAVLPFPRRLPKSLQTYSNEQTSRTIQFS